MTGIEEKNRLSEVVNSAGSLLSPRKYFQPYIKKQNMYRTQRQQLLHTLSAILIHTPRGDWSSFWATMAHPPTARTLQTCEPCPRWQLTF